MFVVWYGVLCACGADVFRACSSREPKCVTARRTSSADAPRVFNFATDRRWPVAKCFPRTTTFPAQWPHGVCFSSRNLARLGPAAHTTRTACCHWQVSWCAAGDMNAQLASTIRRLAGACCSHASRRRMPRAVVTQHASRGVTRGFASAGTGAPSDSGAHQPPLVVMYVSASVCRLSFLLAPTEPLGACRQ